MLVLLSGNSFTSILLSWGGPLVPFPSNRTTPLPSASRAGHRTKHYGDVVNRRSPQFNNKHPLGKADKHKKPIPEIYFFRDFGFAVDLPILLS